MDDQFEQAALEYHQFPLPGKIAVTPTKSLLTQRDLSLAYSPGVAAACTAIVNDPANVSKYTARGNLVAVVTNGTAVLGLGNIGPLAAKPVMEGKGILFKKFAGIDVFDIEIDEKDPDRLVDIIASLQPTFGGINLGDIEAPECFAIEKKLRERLSIPVFHDDQHGTAIIAAAAILNGMKVVEKDLAQAKLVCSGAGAAAIACLELLVALGLSAKNIWVCDSKGVLYKGRDMDVSKAKFARETSARTLAHVIADADIFLGLSGPRVLTQDMVRQMAARPLILALANPEPEILPEEIKAVRDDALIATGRSDYPNQVNNALCFPFIFRGALDVGATSITKGMQLACVHAIAGLAQMEQSAELSHAYGDSSVKYGPDYFIPRPFDPRLILRIAPAVARAAMEDGVATRPIENFDDYREQLCRYVYHSAAIMRPLFAAAKAAPCRVVYCEGEDERVLRAAQIVVDEGVATPVLVGRPQVIKDNIVRLSLRIKDGADVEIVDSALASQHGRDSKQEQQIHSGNLLSEILIPEMHQSTTFMGCMLLKNKSAEALLCGLAGGYRSHLEVIKTVIGRGPGANTFAAINMLLLPNRTLFVADTYVNYLPSPEQLAEVTLLAADEVRRFGLVPKIALLSHSNFGSDESFSAQRIRAALALLKARAPELEVDGEMHGDAALSSEIRARVMPNNLLGGEANLLVMPSLDAANIVFNLLKIISGDGITVGPMLLGTALPAHILTPAATVRRIVNMTARAIYSRA